MTTMHPISYTCIPYSLLTNRILEKCSTLFNNNYGIWSDDASLHSNNVRQAGTRVRLGMKRLREMLLFDNRCFLVVAEKRSLDDDQFELIGHVFCSSTKYDRLNGNLVWITQLVVSSSYRGQGVAGTLISMAKNNVEDVVIIGLASSHPHAVLALANACNRISINVKFIADHAEDAIRACHVPYLSHAQLIGSIFQTRLSSIVNNNQNPISLVNTGFFVDHKEPLALLKDIRDEKWALGPLLNGHEFFVLLPTTSVRRSRTLSNRSSLQEMNQH